MILLATKTDGKLRYELGQKRKALRAATARPSHGYAGQLLQTLPEEISRIEAELLRRKAKIIPVS